jgi:nucleotide-binding universal stress UspA family protein
MISRVLVAMDGSEMSERALSYALDAYPDATITVLHVVGEPSSMWGKATGIALADNIEEAAEEHAQLVFERARELAVDAESTVNLNCEVTLGHPARAIINRASDYDSIVIGSHGGTLADRLFVGNIAEKVFRRSPVPVTVVR